ncbi:TPA: winged helix-turn-helix transcriptional regulator, partial [Candidatus Micrarchaeota archaeon]|nr:winged helix-turn-helix transcriptional regulator [Candidatus Micrarchaeota archaeon]
RIKMTGAGLNEPGFESSTFFRAIFNKHSRPATQKTTQKILDSISKNPEITRKELAVLLGLTGDGVKFHLSNLRKKSLLRRVGPDKGGHWEIIHAKRGD